MHDKSDYFEKIERVMREKGITELDVWNMDETGFRVVKYGQKLQRAYAKLKPGEKIDSEQIQRFIRGSIASVHTLELTARDLKAIQEATTAREKRASLGGQVAQKGGTIKVSECCALCSKRKEKEEEQARKKKEREEKRAEKQANSQLAQLEFLIGGVPTVE